MSGRDPLRPRRHGPPVAGRESLLFYAADCGLCGFFRKWVHRLDIGHRIGSIPLDSREADPYLGGFDDRRRHGSMHAMGPDGNVVSEGQGLLVLVEALPMLGGLSRLLRTRDRGIEAAEIAYTLVVLLRDALAD